MAAARTAGEATAATGMRRAMARLMDLMSFMPDIGAAGGIVTDLLARARRW